METPDIKSLSSLSRSTFHGSADHWNAIKARATYVVGTVIDETIYASIADLSEDALMELTDGWAVDIEEEALAAKDKKVKAPYGDKVHYCDDNMRGDGVKRFPVNNKERAKAAWSYSHHKSIMSKYTSEQLSRLHSCIASAYKKFFGKEPLSVDK